MARARAQRCAAGAGHRELAVYNQWSLSTVFNWKKYGTEVSDRSIVGDCLTQVTVYKPCIIATDIIGIPTVVTVALWPLAFPYIRFGLPYLGQYLDQANHADVPLLVSYMYSACELIKVLSRTFLLGGRFCLEA